MKNIATAAILIGGFIFISNGYRLARADDWPQWRGPARDGISRETGLLKEWPKEGPKQVWHVDDIGDGYSTPVIVGDRIYLIGNKGIEDESVMALDAKNGKHVWATRIGKVGNPDQQPSYPGARSTPTIDGELLYALGSDGDMVCLEAAGGKVRWQKNLRTDFGGQPGVWAYSESPLIDGEALICTPGGATATMIALNKKSGEMIWKCAVPEGDQAAYASAIVVEAGGIRQYVQFLQKGLVGVDAKTGKFLWRYDKTAKGSPANIPTPVAQDGLIYSAAGRSGGGLVKLTAGEKGVNAEPVYFVPKLPTSIGGALLAGDHLYGTTGKLLLCAVFKTGQIVWSDRSVGAGSLCFADGMLYVHGENAEVALVEATPDGYHEKGRFTPGEASGRGPGKPWAYPAVANGRLYIRDQAGLWCYDIRKAPSAG